MLLHLPIIKVLLAFMGTMGTVHIATPKMRVIRVLTAHYQRVNRVSTDPQWSVNQA